MSKGFGPFSVEQGNALAAQLGIPADVGTAAVFSDDVGGFKKRLLAGRSQIMLWKSRPMYGHFFALVPRKGGREVEIYDSQAARGETLRGYLEGKRGTRLNGPPVGWGRRSRIWPRTTMCAFLITSTRRRARTARRVCCTPSPAQLLPR